MIRVGLLAAVAFAALTGTSSAATPGCTLSATDGTVTRTVGQRTYELHVPGGLQGLAVPLLLSLHGAGSTGREDESNTGWSTFADAHGFIVAYPDAHTFSDVTGLPDFGHDAWDPYTEASTDIGFLRGVVADIASRWCVDERRVFTDGWSNGAVMSQRVACDAADVFAAVDSYAGGDPTYWSDSGIPAGPYSGQPCRPARPIAVSLLAGTQDFTYYGLSTNATLWRGLDHCSTAAQSETDGYGSSKTYACADGTQVVSRAVDGASHLWPSGAQGDDQRMRIWSFLLSHPLPCKMTSCAT